MDYFSLFLLPARIFEVCETDVLPWLRNFVQWLRYCLPLWVEKLENYRDRFQLPQVHWLAARPRLRAVLLKMSGPCIEMLVLVGSVALFVLFWRSVWLR